MILIIAEKPSLGRNIADGILWLKRKEGVSDPKPLSKRNGYLEGHGYIVSWAFGHLFSLCDIENYRPLPEGRTGWCMDNIPCFPEKFQFELRKREKGQQDEGVVKQFEILKSLCARPDVDTVVNAGDADREGEIIVRLCMDHALQGCPEKDKKSKKRLWLPDQTPETVAKGLAELKDQGEYDLLACEGYARTYIDWLYGVNLTRYATLRTGTLLRVGRVIVPIVRAIYDRDMAIRNFVPGKYLALQSKEETAGEAVELLSKNRFEGNEREKAEALCKKYNDAGATVLSVKRKKDKLSPGKLYSLSKLQNVLGKKYKMSMNESLEIVQKLYEAGYLTYPRTNSEYLASAEKDKIKSILQSCKKLGYPVAFREDKSIFDDSKIESHSALTPTYKIPDSAKLSEKERQVYSTVFRRFIAVFCAEPCIVTKSEIVIGVGDYEQFTLKGTVIEEPGWTKYDDRQGKDKFLPKLNKGDAVNVDFKPAEKETSPPKHYTIETLNNYLKNPFKEEKAAAKELPAEGEHEDDSEEYRAIFEGLELGTEATRTGIIDNARKSGYIELKKDVYKILPDGEFFIESLEQLKISMDKYKTSELGQALKKVYRGTISVEESVTLAKEQIVAIFDGMDESEDFGFFGDEIGSCPLCGESVVRRRSFYGCSGYKKNGCKFLMSTVLCGRTIPSSAARQLLKGEKTEILEGFKSKKSGKTFSARLFLNEEQKILFEFPDERPREKERPTPDKALCPLCKSAVLKGKSAYGCAGYKDGCTFRLPFLTDDGRTLSDAEAFALIKKMSLEKSSEKTT
jgi:DNA topoisomerase-3